MRHEFTPFFLIGGVIPAMLILWYVCNRMYDAPVVSPHLFFSAVNQDH